MNTNIAGFRWFSKRYLRSCTLDENNLCIRGVKDCPLVRINALVNGDQYVI